MLETKSPQMRKAVGVLKELSADEATRMRYEARERYRRDMESMKDDAIREVEEKWQGVVAEIEATITEQAAENEQLRAQIAALQAQLKSDN